MKQKRVVKNNTFGRFLYAKHCEYENANQGF